MKNIIPFVVVVLMSGIIMAQTGKVMDNMSMTSKILDMDREYAIYLPPDYESSNRSYPVLYLLHGGVVMIKPVGFSLEKYCTSPTKQSMRVMLHP